jgi:hypothetical protein
MAATFPRPGPTGAAGPAGISPFVWVQAVPSSEFNVPHMLGREPVSVTAYDSSQNECQVGVTVVDDDNIQVTTEAELPFSGKVLVI